MYYKIGVDVGGTNTDAVLVSHDNNILAKTKQTTTLNVSTGIENFNVNGTEYFGLSTQAPLYKNMAGCKAGDKVSFHGIEYSISEIY